jgi:hypothetical protein
MNDLLDHCKQYFNFLRTENTFNDGVTPAFAATATQQHNTTLASHATSSTEEPSTSSSDEQGGQVHAFRSTKQNNTSRASQRVQQGGKAPSSAATRQGGQVYAPQSSHPVNIDDRNLGTKNTRGKYLNNRGGFNGNLSYDKSDKQNNRCEMQEPRSDERGNGESKALIPKTVKCLFCPGNHYTRAVSATEKRRDNKTSDVFSVLEKRTLSNRIHLPQ